MNRRDIIANIIFVIVIIIIGILTSACKEIRYVEKPVIQHDTLIQNRIVVDSTIRLDSVVVKETGDTVFKYQYRYIDRWRIKVDSVYVSKIDTVTVIKYVSVEKKRSIIDRLKSGWRWLLILIIILSFLYISYKLVRRIYH